MYFYFLIFINNEYIKLRYLARRIFGFAEEAKIRNFLETFNSRIRTELLYLYLRRIR